MHVAVAGSGDVAVYLCEELTKAGHVVTLLTRSTKERFNSISGVTQNVVDFHSVSSLVEALGNETQCLLSAIMDYSMGFKDCHLNLIEACKNSAQCKRFIPAEYNGNIEEYPDQPFTFYASHEPVRKALREQSEIEWTLVCTSWFMDYVVPTQNRHLKEVGDGCPINLKDRRMVFPGAGIEILDVVSVRDVATAVVAMLDAPLGSWEPYTYFSAEKTCWKEVANKVEKAYPGVQFEKKTISLTQLMETVHTAKEDDALYTAGYQIFSISNTGNFDPSRVAAHRKKYFPSVKFHTVQELLDKFNEDRNVVI